MNELEQKIRRSAERLAKRPTASTQHMDEQERADGINQMLQDLYMLAKKDGCIAAAWAYEFAMERAVD